MNEQGVEQDRVTSPEWYQRAAEAGDPQAMHWVGEVYRRGLGVLVNMELADEWQDKVIASGYVLLKLMQFSSGDNGSMAKQRRQRILRRHLLFC